MDNNNKPSVALKLLAGGIAGVSETIVTVPPLFFLSLSILLLVPIPIPNLTSKLTKHLPPVPRRIHQNPPPTPQPLLLHIKNLLPRPHPQHLPHIRTPGLLLRLRRAGNK